MERIFILLETSAAIPESSHNWLRDALLMSLCGLVIGWLGYCLAFFLKKRHFDDLFQPPWKPLFSERKTAFWRASNLLGLFVTLTGLVLLVWLFMQWHALQATVLDRLLEIGGQAWLLLITTLVALGIAKVVAAAVISIFNNRTIRTQLEFLCPHEAWILENPPPRTTAKTETALRFTEAAPPADPTSTGSTPDESIPDESSPVESVPPSRWKTEKTSELAAHSPAKTAVLKTTPEEATFLPPARESFADTIARLVGLLVYVIVFLPVFMIAAEIWQWNDTGTAIAEIWQWLLPFVGLSAVVLIGWFAITAAAVSVSPAEHRRTVMIVTTLLAVLLLTASYNIIFATIFGVTLLLTAWFSRNELPDVFASLYLQWQEKPTVKTIDGPARVQSVQLLTSDLTTISGEYRVRNRYVLRSFLDGNLIEENRMVKI